MGAIRNGPNGATEHCPACDRETDHAVEIEIRTESEDEKNAAFSREPYRVSRCRVCGDERSQRMNNA